MKEKKYNRNDSGFHSLSFILFFVRDGSIIALRKQKILDLFRIQTETKGEK